MEVTISPTPYVFHKNRFEKYNIEIKLIEMVGTYNCDQQGRKIQALRNLCWETYFDATIHLSGKRVCITQDGHILGSEYHVIGVSMMNVLQKRDRPCFGIIYKDRFGNESTLEITPKTKITMYLH